jgi:predicted ABC-type ATPase
MELAQTGHLDLRPWGVERDPVDALDFARQHPLAHRASAESLSADQHSLLAISRVPSGYLASIVSDYLRRYWLQTRTSFTFETVMSNRDKLDLLVEARRAGYRTYLYYICTDAPVINQRRVVSRVQDGGHDVPADKIISRYERSLGLLPEAIRLSDRAYLFDNSGQSHRLFAEFELGRPVNVGADTPEWFQAARI